MRTESLDCRGLACPNPVLRTKEVIERGDVDSLTVAVDNQAARENVSRFLGRFGFSVSVVEKDGVFEVNGVKDGSQACEVYEQESAAQADKKVVVLLGTEMLGRGDDVLGRKLVLNFLLTLKEMGKELWRLVLVNGGVKLSVEGSEALGSLRELEGEGAKVLVCGTCLNHFGLLEQKKVGETTNMLDIVTAMQLADKVISLT
ncbi:MAG: sulfurtransferase-like selenium metabolism protein YedF [Syntrophobacter sp.]